MDFRILTDTNTEIYEGMIIDYTVKPLFGIKMHWQTEICKIEKPFFFTDRQVKGPYRLWEHTHMFIKKDNGVLIKDEVKYKLPFGIAGRLMHALVVRKKIESIFLYRKKCLIKIFEKNESTD